MPPTPQQENPLDRVLNHGGAAVSLLRRFFAGYFWLILKNVVGWLLILASPFLGVTIPGPGGLPVFLLGFALVAFPGKRKITSHVLRGRPLRIEATIFTSLTTVSSLIVIGFLLWFVGDRYQQLIAYFNLDPKTSTPGFILAVAGLCVMAAVVTWAVMRLLLLSTNKIIRIVPRIRRFIRPFLRKWGIVLLPPQRRDSGPGAERAEGEILELSETSRRRFSNWWYASKPWARRFIGFGIVASLFYLVIAPIAIHWRDVEPHLNRVRPVAFVAGVFLLAGVLYAFRAVTWWTILRVGGQKLSLATTTRIWGTSELSRYLPGLVWQVLGRAFLCRPYGISGSLCAASQVVELTAVFLAHLIVGLECVIWFGFDRVDNAGRWWLLALALLVPMLAFLVHPGAIRSVSTRVLRTLGRPPMEIVTRGRVLLLLLVWNIVGIVIVSLAIWSIIGSPLRLGLEDWWIPAAAYSLAWCAGFVAFWAPGGLGVREFIFAALLAAMLPAEVRSMYGIVNLHAFTGALALVLRVWSIAAEIIVALTANAMDLEGALRSVRDNRPMRRAA